MILIINDKIWFHFIWDLEKNWFDWRRKLYDLVVPGEWTLDITLISRIWFLNSFFILLYSEKAIVHWSQRYVFSNVTSDFYLAKNLLYIDCKGKGFHLCVFSYDISNNHLVRKHLDIDCNGIISWLCFKCFSRLLSTEKVFGH